MRLLCLLLMFTSTINCYQDPTIDRDNVLEKALRSGTVVFPNYSLVTRQLSTDVFIYENYRSVSLVFYPIEKDLLEARFTFHSSELRLNNFVGNGWRHSNYPCAAAGSCKPSVVIVNIKHSAYPALNPDGYNFPKDFIKLNRRERIHTIELLSDGKNVSYSIENPKPGIWYSISYVKWEDPRTQNIVQQGLVADCQTILYSDLQVKREESIHLIDCYENTTLDDYDVPALFKCMSLESGNPISLRVKRRHFREIYIAVEAMSIPTENDNILYCALDTGASVQVIKFIPHPAIEHYILLGNVESNNTRVPKCEALNLRAEFEEFTNHTIVDLIRIDKGRFFAFDYRLPSKGSDDDISVINITSSEIRSLRFKINQFVDIGGSLLVSASLLMNLKYYMEYRRESQKQSLLAYNQENQFFKAVICLDIGRPSIPLDTGHCKYNNKIQPALFVLNSMDSNSIYGKTYIPFPESGYWYLTLRIFCGEKGGCKADNGSIYYADTPVDIEEGPSSVISFESNGSSCVGPSECSTTIVLSVSSMSCVNSKCSNNGDCRLHGFGGLVMSFCSCLKGYGGWDCSDTTRMDSRTYMLMSVLLLTLSNLLFVLSIYVAIIRLYFTEAVIYTFTMFFSTFYHACDAPPQVAFCIFQGSILQFGDFYFANMSFWVTLIAMSIIGDDTRSFLHLTGASVTAILLTWNTFSCICFVTPAIAGAAIMVISWYLYYKKHRTMKYSKTYYFKFMPLGGILMFIGFICFAFLQTNQNYMIVHSLWHMIVALSIVLLLPDLRSEADLNAFKPSHSLKVNILKYFRKSQPSQPPPEQAHSQEK